MSRTADEEQSTLRVPNDTQVPFTLHRQLRNFNYSVEPAASFVKWVSAERAFIKHLRRARQCLRRPPPPSSFHAGHLITLAAFTSLQALSRPNPCWWLWLKPASLVIQSARRSSY